MGTFPSANDIPTSMPQGAGGVAQAAPVTLSTAPAQALQSIGRDQDGMATEIDRFGLHLDTLAAQDAVNKLRAAKDDLTVGQQNGFMNIKGIDVLKPTAEGTSMQEAFPKRFQAAADAIGKTLLGGRAAQLYQQKVAEEGESFKVSLANHALRQTEVANKSIYTDGITQDLTDAVRSASDPAALDTIAARAAKRTGYYAAQEGLEPKALMDGARSNIYRGAIESFITANNGPAAVNAFERYKGSLDGKDLLEVGRAIKTVQIGQNAQAFVASLMPGATGIGGGAGPILSGDSAAVVRHFEGFTDKPKVDNDGKLRAGYGSDTVTRADGSFAPVTADTVVTREDAERDLRRRLPQFEAGARDKVGADVWQALPSNTRASLASIAYNYGSLPDSIAAAARTKDPAQIAAAIRARAGDNGGINAVRRGHEAVNATTAAPSEPGEVPPISPSSVGAVPSLRNPVGPIATPPQGDGPDPGQPPSQGDDTGKAPAAPKAEGPPGFLDTRAMTIQAEQWRVTATARNQAQFANDPAQQSANQSLINVQYEAMKARIELSKQQLFEKVDQWIKAGGPGGAPATDRPPADIWDQLPYEKQRSIDATLAHNAKGQDPPDTPAAKRVWMKLNDLANDEPDLFKKLDLTELISTQPKARLNQLQERRDAIATKDQKEYDTSKALGMADRTLALAGVDVRNAGASDKDVTLRAAMHAQLLDWLGRFQIENKRPAKDSEVRQQVDNMLIEGKTQHPNWYERNAPWILGGENNDQQGRGPPNAKGASGQRGTMPGGQFLFTVPQAQLDKFYVPYSAIPADKKALVEQKIAPQLQGKTDAEKQDLVEQTYLRAMIRSRPK